MYTLLVVVAVMVTVWVAVRLRPVATVVTVKHCVFTVGVPLLAGAGTTVALPPSIEYSHAPLKPGRT